MNYKEMYQKQFDDVMKDYPEYYDVYFKEYVEVCEHFNPECFIHNIPLHIKIMKAKVVNSYDYRTEEFRITLNVFFKYRNNKIIHINDFITHVSPRALIEDFGMPFENFTKDEVLDYIWDFDIEEFDESLEVLDDEDFVDLCFEDKEYFHFTKSEKRDLKYDFFEFYTLSHIVTWGN